MSDNPAPATFLLISGNDSFSRLLHDLSVRSHNILLSGPSQLDESLTANANFIWHWPTLISQGRPLNTAEQVNLQNLNPMEFIYQSNHNSTTSFDSVCSKVVYKNNF